MWDISKQCPTITIRQQKNRIALKEFSPISDADGTGNNDCGFTESSIPYYSKSNSLYLDTFTIWTKLDESFRLIIFLERFVEPEKHTRNRGGT